MKLIFNIRLVYSRSIICVAQKLIQRRFLDVFLIKSRVCLSPAILIFVNFFMSILILISKQTQECRTKGHSDSGVVEHGNFHRFHWLFVRKL